MREITTRMIITVNDEQYENYGKIMVEEIESGGFDANMISSGNLVSSKTSVEVREIDEG